MARAESTVNYFEKSWCGLAWTPWVQFDASRPEWKTIPQQPGVYRVRPIGGYIIVYIGQTGRGLRTRLGVLRRHTLSQLIPYDDPHTAAPSLWVWRQEENWQYECSVAPVAFDEASHKALECYLLWQYRVERGESTLCNHGRFHRKYFKSSVRSKGIRGGELPNGKENPAGGPSHPPLLLQGNPAGQDWMGLQWTAPMPLNGEEQTEIPPRPGLYRILDFAKDDAIYFGETKDLTSRINTHRRDYDQRIVHYSYHILPDNLQHYQRNELENDLIGGYYSRKRSAPSDQFGKGKR